MSGKTHGVGLGREKQARKPSPEADRQVAGRKLGVRRKQAEKPTSWVQEEKNKRENPPRKLIDGERRENWA